MSRVVECANAINFLTATFMNDAAVSLYFVCWFLFI